MGNYRPILLIPTIFRFIKKAICDPFVSHLEVNNHLCGWQYGFRKLIPTKLDLIDLFNAFVDAMEAIETVIGKIADLSKALNCVDAITILFQKLTALGIKNIDLDWIISWHEQPILKFVVSP